MPGLCVAGLQVEILEATYTPDVANEASHSCQQLCIIRVHVFILGYGYPARMCVKWDYAVSFVCLSSVICCLSVQ